MVTHKNDEYVSSKSQAVWQLHKRSKSLLSLFITIDTITITELLPFGLCWGKRSGMTLGATAAPAGEPLEVGGAAAAAAAGAAATPLEARFERAAASSASIKLESVSKSWSENKRRINAYKYEVMWSNRSQRVR